MIRVKFLWQGGFHEITKTGLSRLRGGMRGRGKAGRGGGGEAHYAGKTDFEDGVPDTWNNGGRAGAGGSGLSGICYFVVQKASR